MDAPTETLPPLVPIDRWQVMRWCVLHLLLLLGLCWLLCWLLPRSDTINQEAFEAGWRAAERTR